MQPSQDNYNPQGGNEQWQQQNSFQPPPQYQPSAPPSNYSQYPHQQQGPHYYPPRPMQRPSSRPPPRLPNEQTYIYDNNTPTDFSKARPPRYTMLPLQQPSQLPHNQPSRQQPTPVSSLPVAEKRSQDELQQHMHHMAAANQQPRYDHKNIVPVNQMRRPNEFSYPLRPDAQTACWPPTEPPLSSVNPSQVSNNQQRSNNEKQQPDACWPNSGQPPPQQQPHFDQAENVKNPSPVQQSPPLDSWQQSANWNRPQEPAPAPAAANPPSQSNFPPTETGYSTNPPQWIHRAPDKTSSVSSSNRPPTTDQERQLDVDLGICLRVLKKAGYPAVASVIEEDMMRGIIGSSDTNAAEKMRSAAVGQQLLSAAKRLTPKENPLACYKNFVQLYGGFWEWCQRAVDSVRTCFREIAFVVFVELWCRLLPLSIERAEAFVQAFAKGHYFNHREEISEMKRVKSFAVVKDLAFVARVIRGERFQVKVDFLSRKLLTTRLTLDNDTVILDILQKRIIFEVPADGASDSSSGTCHAATLACLAFRALQGKEVGSAVVTPSLALLCGLLPDPPGADPPLSDKLRSSEPRCQFLSQELVSMYRIPHSGVAGLEWKHTLRRQLKLEGILGREPITPKRLPSILMNDLKNGPFGVIAVEKANATMVAAAHKTNSIWIWDLQEAQWQRCSNMYREGVLKPWLYSYAQFRSKEPELVAQQERNDLESSGIVLQIDGNQVNISGSELDDVYEKVGDDQDLFLKGLDLPWLQPKSYQPICLSGHKSAVTGIKLLDTFLTGGISKLALSGSYDGELKLWDVKNSYLLYTYSTGGSPILSIDGDTYGYLFLTGQLDRAACLWSMDRSTPLRVLNRHGSSVEVVKFHPNSILLASGAADDRIRLWDPRVPDIVGLIQGVSFPKVLEFSNDGTMLAISGSSSEAYVWDLVAGKVANKFNTGHHVTSMSFAHGGEILAMTVGKNRIQIWDTMGTATECQVAAMDLCGFDENSNVISVANDIDKRLCVAEYKLQDKSSHMVKKQSLGMIIIQVSFTDFNILTAINEENL